MAADSDTGRVLGGSVVNFELVARHLRKPLAEFRKFGFSELLS